MRTYSDCLRFFRGRLHYYVAPINPSDHQKIELELKKIEEIIKDSTVNTIKISDNLFSLLSKYSASYYLLTDITEYYTSFFRKSNLCHDIFLSKVFLIDKKTKSVVYYNYDIQKNGLHEFRFYNPIFDPPNIKKILKGLEESFYKSGVL